MDYKTTLTHVFSILRNRSNLWILFLVALLSMTTAQIQAQTLKTGSQLVTLDACSEAKEFSVKIAKGSKECSDGILKIEIPNGFELIIGSVKVDGVSAVMNNETVNGGIIKLPIIAAGSMTDEITITFYVKALCEVIGIPADGNVIEYTFSGCGNNVPQTGSSETINIRYAVLRVSVSPNPILGVIGDEIERTVTIINQGNGDISNLQLDRLLGSGLSHIGYDFSTVVGWTVDSANSNNISFSSNTLKSGQSITFKEKVRIEACALTPSEYEVYYGCSLKCERSNVNGKAKHIINIKVADAPQLEVKANTPTAACFNGYVPQTWTITNKGGLTTEAIEFEIGTNDLGGYINPNTIKVDGISVPALGTPGNEPKNVKINISDLAPGSSVVLTFDQYLIAPNGTAADCANAPTSFTNNSNYFGASYTFEGACAPMIVSKEVNKEVTYSFDGKHIGEVDVVNGENFEADFLFKNFKIPSAGLAVGDSFSVIITLSPDLSILDSSDISITLGGATVTAVATGSGNEYKLTFTYGTAPWNLNSDLNLSTARLKFPLELTCPMTDDLWYRIGGELNKKDEIGAACSSIVFNCKQTELKGNCDAGPCANGLQNGTAFLTRAILGYKVDAVGAPNLSVTADPNDVQIRTFIIGDILEISQDSRVVIAPAESFTKVKMVVEKDFNTTTSLVVGSGKVKVTRGGVEYLFTNLAVTEVGSNYVLEFDAIGEAGLNDVLLNNDDVRLSLQVKALSAVEELTKFPTNSYLVRGNEVLKCGRDYTATGFYVPVKYNFDGGIVDFVSCVDNTNTATFSTTVFDIDRQDAIFTNEFRKLFKARKATLTIPAQLELTGIKVTVKNQPWLGINNVAMITGLTVSNGVYVLNLETILNTITNNALLDEGFVLEITPTVSLLGCEPAANLKELKIGINLEGITYDGVGVETPYSETKDLKYNTGIGTLGIELSNGETFGTFNPAGTHVSWVVKVGSLGVRNFNSVWIAKDSGALEIESIVPVSDYVGANPGVALTTDANGLYRLGDFPSGISKYYLITSKVIDCKVEELVLVSGYNCASNNYPLDSNSGCGLEKITLTHDELKDILQTDIVDASNQTGQQDFCSELWYKIQIHNAGDTEAKDLKVRIPLTTAPGLEFNRFEFSNVFSATDLNPTIGFSAGTNFLVSNDTLILTLPNTVKLNTLDRVQVKVFFDINGCDFRSGSKLAFTGLGNNVCDAIIDNVTTTTSKRIIIEGGSTSFPELETKHHEIVLDPVLTEGGVLRATYNFELKNTGQFGNNDPITNEYYFSVKLPTGWSIVGNPQDYIQPAGKVEYLGIDQLDNRGYFYQVTQDIGVGETMRLVNVPLKYTVQNETTLTCNHDFGIITATVFQNIDVSSCNTPSCPKGIDQVLLENSIPMVLPVDGILTIDPPQQTRIICNPLSGGGVPTLADVTFTNGFYLSWYENEQEAIADIAATRLPLSTPLVHDRTYYVINRFIADGACKSNIGAIKVLLNNEVLTASTDLICAIDQKTYTVNVTLNGVAPFTVSGTGIVGTTIINNNVWTSSPIAGGTNYAFTFTDAENCTPLIIQGDAPVCCTLQIECPVAVTITCEQGYNPEVTGIPTIITSCGNTTYTYADGPISNCTAGVKSFIRTFTVTDGSGNIETCEQTIYIEDKVAPVLNKKPQSITVSCESNTVEALESWLKNHGGAEATDACGTVVWTNNFDSISFVALCGDKAGSYTVTFTATDACGNSVSEKATFTIEDKTAPTITKPANGLTLECSQEDYQDLLDAWLASNGGAIAIDTCSSDITWSHNFVIITEGSCPGTGSALVTFTATDDCGNRATTAATFNVVDKTAPTFTKLPENKIVECDGKGNLDGPDGFHAWLANHGGAEATDGCSTVTWTTTHIEDTNTICGITGTVIVDFIVTDACGNMAFEQATFAIKDTVAPTIDKEATDLEIECGVNVEDELNAWLSNFGGAKATDSCGMVTWEHDYAGKLTVCGAPIEVTFTVTDACNNKSYTKATVKVVDTVAPTITKAAQSTTVACGTSSKEAYESWLANHGGAEAADDCSSVITWTNNSKDVAMDVVCGNTGSYTITFTASDACGNTVTTTATFTIEDTTAPTFVGTLPVEKMTVSCDVIPATPILVAKDNCGEATISFTEKRVGGLCANSYDLVRVWTATDSCGNSTSFTQTITVEDKVAPKFVEDLPSNITVSCLNDVPAAKVLTAEDNCGDADVVMTETKVAGTCVNSFVLTRIWTATDACGNSISHTQIITVEDKIAPKFIEDLPSNITVSCLNDVPAAKVLTAEDNCGTADVVMTETKVAGTCVNSFVLTRIWTATDACGNSISHTQIITVEDKIAPKFIEDLPSNITVSCLNDVPAAKVLTAEDNCGDADVVLKETQVDGSCVNSFVITRIWTATDLCGNSVSHTQIVTVEDKIAPKFVEALPSNITVSCIGEVPVAADLTAEDNCGTADVVMTESKVNGTCGTNAVIKRTWTATDSCGNAVAHTQVIIVADKTAPEFTTVPTDIAVECDGAGNKASFQTWLNSNAGAIATDGCNTDLTWTTETVDTVVLCGKTSKTTVKFTVTDACGNSVSKQATFTIVDTTAPEMDLEAKDLEIECGTEVEAQITTWLNNHGGAVSSDNCGTIKWTNNYTGLKGVVCDGINGRSALVVFTATDSCGNVSTTEATVRIVDTILPSLVRPAQDLTVPCESNVEAARTTWLANNGGAFAKDSCSAITWSNNYDEANFVPTCGNAGSVEVIFTATDSCGNELTTTATFTIVDVTAPEIVKPAKNQIVECDGLGNLDSYNTWLASNGGATATDSCGAVVWSNNGATATFVKGCSDNTGTKEVTFTAADACGNTVITVATFTIVDTTAPLFTTVPQNLEVECDGNGNVTEFNSWVANHGNAVAQEACSSVVWSHAIVDTNNSCGNTKSITVNFTATDSCGNVASKQAVFTIIDTIGPDITVKALDTTVACDGNGNATDLATWLANNGGAKAKDVCSNTITWTNNFTGLVRACGSTGSATVTFTATDSCGNESVTTATFTIEDNEAPVFTTNLPKDMTLECSAGIPEAAVMNAVDACSTATIEFTEERITGACLGSYELVRTWTATDSCGNAVSHVQTITIEDTTAPVFVDPLPAKELFLSCEDVKEREELKAIDSCGTVTVTYVEETIAGDCPNRYDLLRTWTATDSCGNETEFEQTIHVACKIEFTNAISANGDGINDEFQLKGIECYPGNTVEIFNRWGKLVYSTTNYNSNGNVFKGYANTKHVVSGGEKLPTGTYFYVVKYDFSLGNGNIQAMDQSGYIHLESN